VVPNEEKEEEATKILHQHLILLFAVAGLEEIQYHQEVFHYHHLIFHQQQNHYSQLIFHQHVPYEEAEVLLQ
jgi:hypothetical protein